MKLKASREYIVMVMGKGVENIVNISSVKTCPSGNLLERCGIDKLTKKFCRFATHKI